MHAVVRGPLPSLPSCICAAFAWGRGLKPSYAVPMRFSLLLFDLRKAPALIGERKGRGGGAPSTTCVRARRLAMTCRQPRTGRHLLTRNSVEN